MRRSTAQALAATCLALLLTGCGGDTVSTRPAGPSSDGSGTTPATSGATALTVVRSDDGTTATEQTWQLSCDPLGGDHPQAAAACAAVKAGGPEVFAPPLKDRMCTEIYGGPQTATVTGTVSGQPVQATFSRTDGCGIDRWESLLPLLGPGGAGDV